MGQHGVQAHCHEHEVLTGGADGAQIAHTGGVLEHTHDPGDTALLGDFNQHVRAAAAALGQGLLQGVQHHGQGTVGGDVGLGDLTGQGVDGAGRFGLRLRLRFRGRLRLLAGHHLHRRLLFHRLFRSFISTGGQPKHQGQGQQQSDPFFH